LLSVVIPIPVVPFMNCTSPVGVPLPEVGVTVAVRVMGVVEPCVTIVEDSVSDAVVGALPMTVTVNAVEVEGASLAPSPLKQATMGIEPGPNSLPVTFASVATELQLVLQEVAGTRFVVPSRISVQAYSWKLTVPSGGAIPPRPVAVTVAVSVVVGALEFTVVGLADPVVVLANCCGTLVQLLTRFAMLMLPRPVASL